MTTHTFSQTTFKSRSGQMLSFKDAIDKAGKKRFGNRWLSVVTDVPPTILPDSVYDASADQVGFAVLLLYRQDPPVIVKHHANETDDSVPGFLANSSFDLDFSDEQWLLAQELSNQHYNELFNAHQKLLKVLNKFADSASCGKIKLTFDGLTLTRTKNSDRISGKSIMPSF